MDGSEPMRGRGLLDASDIAAYRRDGHVLVRGLIAPRLVAAALDAISGLASGRIAPRSTQIAFEPGVDPAGIAPDAREGFIRKFAGFIEDSEALRAIAMSRRLHLILDQLLGQGREVLQDMALIKPPRVGGAKPWHQDAAYFRVRDPSLIVGVWTLGTSVVPQPAMLTRWFSPPGMSSRSTRTASHCFNGTRTACEVSGTAGAPGRSSIGWIKTRVRAGSAASA